MRISSNELSVTVTKACVGAGVPRGVAEDIGAACLQLALDGRDCIASVHRALSGFNATCEAPDWRKEGAHWEASSVCCLPHGPSVIDFAHLARALHPDGKALVGQIDHPDLIEGLAAADGMEFEVGFEGHGLWVQMGTTRRSSSVALHRDIDVNADDWRSLQELAAQIMVPADDSNLADAGAGTSDND